MKSLSIIASVAATLFALQAFATPEVKTLKDGTSVTVKDDNTVWVMKDGANVNAADGAHVLSDDTTIVVKDGKLVK